jgi:beta-lactamase regulating signal transducer with metallopeptidase domain
VNAIGIALIWCIVQVTFLGTLATGLYLLVRRLRPAAAAPVVFSSLAVVVILSSLALSPWPRWAIERLASCPETATTISPRPLREGPGVRAEASSAPESQPQTPKSDSPFDVKPNQPPSQTSTAHRIETPPNPAARAAKAVPASADSRPSSARLLWQTLLAELSGAQPAADATWRWPAVVGLALIAIMAGGLGWLLLGMLAVRRQRLRSRAILDADLLETVDVLCAELACVRPIAVRESSDLVTAATIGWRRPVVLLPADWRTWTSDQQRAVLAHEIVHARSQDFLTLLFGQLGLMLHCYNPLLHWLMNRLRLEQELAADAAAAQILGGPRQYLSTIAELALRTEDRRLSWPTRSFLPTRTTFLRRIAVLRDSKVDFDRLSPSVRWTIIGVVVFCGILVAGLRGPTHLAQVAAATPSPTVQPATTPQPQPTTKPPVATQPPVATRPPIATQPPVVTQPPTPTPPPAAAQPPAPIAAAPQDGGRLRYACQKGGHYFYTVKIDATLPDTDVTHAGTLVCDVVSSNDEQFTLSCRGSLHPSYRPKIDASSRGVPMGFGGPRGMFGPPRIPFPPRHFGGAIGSMWPQDTIFDRRGKVVRKGESNWLPLLLGNEVELMVEELPDEAKPAWTTERDLGVIERDESGPAFSPFPFARGGNETNRGARERIEYAVVGQDQDAVRITKKYSLKTLAEQGVTYIDMSGSGELVFERRLGVVKSQNMKYQLRFNEKNVAVTVPFSLDCRLLSDQEMAEYKRKAEEQMAKHKAEAAARAEADKPRAIPPAEKKKLLKELHAADERRVQEAAKRLSKAIADDDTAQMSKALCAAYKNQDDWTQAEVMAALRVWAAPDAEQLVIEASRHSSFMVRRHAIPALGRFKTAAAAEAAVAQVAHNRHEVEAALKAIGPAAEPATIGLLRDSSIWVRAAAANVLAEIGSKKGLDALSKELRQRPNEVREVATAIAAIERRLGDDEPAAADEDKPRQPSNPPRATHDRSDAKPKPKSTTAKQADQEEASEAAITLPMRTWRDASGTYKVRAAFIELVDNKVTLKRADGQVISIPLKKLSKADQDFAKERAEAAETGIQEDPFK